MLKGKLVSLKGKNNFKGFSDSAQTIVTPFYVLHYKKTSLSLNRLGVIVTKRIGCAVIRNKIRRSVKEQFRLSFKEFKKDEFDFLVIIRKRFVEKNNNFVRSTLHEKIRQITSQ